MTPTLGQRFTDLFRKVAGRVLLSEGMKSRFVTKLNEKLDIPLPNEEEEAKLIGLVWDTMEETIREELGLA